MHARINPLMPTPFDLAWSIVALVGVTLFVCALVSLIRTAKHLTPMQSLAWVAIILLIPLIGSLCWLLAGHRSVRAHHSVPNLDEQSRS